MQLPLPLITNVVLIGGGHAHALVLKKWAMKPVAGARLTIINPAATAPYTGMLPGFVAGHYERDELDIDLVRLSRKADARLVFGAATSIDRVAKTITVTGRPAIPYDVCSIDVGINSAMPEVSGFAEHALAAKPLDRFATEWTNFVAEAPSAPRVVMIGAGVAGCELALAIEHRLRTEGRSATVTVVEAAKALGNLGERARSQLMAAMTKRGITLLEDTRVDHIAADAVHLLGRPGERQGSTRSIPADLVVGAAGARPYPWLAELGLEHEFGFLTVDNTLQTTTDPDVFAAGDCAHMAFAPRPKAGVFAVRQAPVLFDNLQAAITGGKLSTFSPQQDYLKLISLGNKRAAADKFKRVMQGKSLWRLKNGIDRSFMNKLNDLEPMKPEKLPSNAAAGLAVAVEDEPPLCGGCGAKVGADILSGPLAALPVSSRDDIVKLPGDDAALLDFGGTKQVITTDSLRSFTTDPYRMAKVAALHAMGDIWAMGAAPQAVLVTVTLPQLGRRLQAEWLAEIMAGASEALAPSGAEIVGGHTSMGAELSLGFSITGLVEGDAITLAGAQPGDALVLTRPIGSGVLFAAEMQLQADGNDIEALLATLEMPQHRASELLAGAGATAMTDVTGFGLAGHLFGMLRESDVAAELQLDAVPLFAGAVALAEAGVRSHLHAANQVGVPMTSSGVDPRENLLFDPQTAGGFLAAVPPEGVPALLTNLAFADSPSARIGTIVAGEPSITVI